MEKLEELYKKTKNGHVKLMTRILRGDWAAAEDVVQEAYTRALQYYPSYDPNRGPLVPWFNRIMYNALRDIQREYKNRPTENCDELCVEDVISINEMPETLVDKIQSVKNEKHQRVIYLFYILGYSSKEISEIEEGVTQTNVTTIVNRFKESLI